MTCRSEHSTDNGHAHSKVTSFCRAYLLRSDPCDRCAGYGERPTIVGAMVFGVPRDQVYIRQISWSPFVRGNRSQGTHQLGHDCLVSTSTPRDNAESAAHTQRRRGHRRVHYRNEEVAGYDDAQDENAARYPNRSGFSAPERSARVDEPYIDRKPGRVALLESLETPRDTREPQRRLHHVPDSRAITLSYIYSGRPSSTAKRSR
jgi:hypothetical protein